MGVAGQVSCRACGAAAAAGAVDVRRSILICTHCAAITDLSGASAGAPALPGLRALPAAPPGILVEEDGESLRFRWRSFRSQGVVLLVLSLAWIVVVQYWMGGMAVLQEQLPKRLVFAVPGLVGIYFSLARILNATVVRADARTLEVLHGPIPVRRGLRVPASDVEQLFTVSRRDLWGTHPELRVRLRGRGPVAFGRLDDPGPALFIERTLEAFLRLEDRVSAFEPVLP